MLRISSLSVYYGAVRALSNISIHIKKGEFVCLIGSNGAGKTSLLNGLMGIVPADAGEVVFDNNDISALPTKKKVKLGLCLVPEGRRVFPDMDVYENLEMGAYLQSLKTKKRQLEFVFDLFPVLEERSKQLAGMLSGGEQQMLAIGRALMSNPKLLLMDEPSMGLAPIIVKDVYSKLTQLKERGLTIFLVEQNASIALKYADRGYVLENGKIVLQGNTSQLIDDNEIKRAYLGKEYKEKWER
jgi:branched-chain amino acid transport system ATP-binding protein